MILDQFTPPPVKTPNKEAVGIRRPALTRLSTFESLKFREFRWLWIGSLSAFMAMNMAMITRSWLVLRLANDSPLALALVMMGFAVPVTFISPIGGVLADRFSRKYMVMYSQAGNVVLTVILATLDLTGWIRFWHLLAIGALSGLFMALNMPSRQALVSDIIPVDKLMNAISLNNSGMNLSRIVGPAVAGLLIIYIDTAGVFYIVAAFYICAVLSVAMLKINERKSDGPVKSVTADIRDGMS